MTAGSRRTRRRRRAGRSSGVAAAGRTDRPGSSSPPGRRRASPPVRRGRGTRRVGPAGTVSSTPPAGPRRRRAGPARRSPPGRPPSRPGAPRWTPRASAVRKLSTGSPPGTIVTTVRPAARRRGTSPAATSELLPDPTPRRRSPARADRRGRPGRRPTPPRPKNLAASASPNARNPTYGFAAAAVSCTSRLASRRRASSAARRSLDPTGLSTPSGRPTAARQPRISSATES